MIILMFINTNRMQFRALENLFNPVQVKWTLQWDTLFEGFEWDHSPKKESLTKMTICLVKPSKYFLLISMTCYLYSDTLLWSCLSPETNGLIMQCVDQILYPHSWATAHFWVLVITQHGPTKCAKPSNLGVFYFVKPHPEPKMGPHMVYQVFLGPKCLGEGPQKILWT